MAKLYKEFIGEIDKKSIDLTNKTAWVKVSDQSVDSYDEVILQNGWDFGRYEKHSPFVARHDYYSSLMNQIGQALDWKVVDNALWVNFKWFTGILNEEGKSANPEADWAWILASKFGVAAFSVGFYPREYIYSDDEAFKTIYEANKANWKRIPRLLFSKSELLEVSQVIVPANENAIQNAYDSGSSIQKQIAVITAKEFNISTSKADSSTAITPVKGDGSSSHPHSLSLDSQDFTVLKDLFSMALAPLIEVSNKILEKLDEKDIPDEDEPITGNETGTFPYESQNTVDKENIKQISSDIDEMKGLLRQGSNSSNQ